MNKPLAIIEIISSIRRARLRAVKINFGVELRYFSKS